MNATGNRIRAARKARGLTLRELASRSGLSASFLSQAERGISKLRVVSLFAISEALGASPAELLGELEASRPSFSGREDTIIVTPVDASLVVKVPGWPVTYKWLSGPSSPLSAEMSIAVIPGNTNTPTRQHAGEEFGYVLKGSAMLQVGSAVYRIATGDAFQLRATEPHGISTTSEAAEILFFQTVKYTMWDLDPRRQGRARSTGVENQESHPAQYQ